MTANQTEIQIDGFSWKWKRWTLTSFFFWFSKWGKSSCAPNLSSPLWRIQKNACLLVVWSFDQNKKISHWPMLTFQQLCTSFQCLPDSPPDSQGGGYFKYRVGRESNKLDCTLPPTLAWGVQGHKLEWGCKTDWFGISALKKTVDCFATSAQPLFYVCWLRLHSGNNKRNNNCLFVWFFLRANPWRNTEQLSEHHLLWHHTTNLWNTTFTIK